MIKPGNSPVCALCLRRRTRAGRRPELPRDLHHALQTCCHLWVPDADDPICETCRNYLREHLRRHDGTQTTYRVRDRGRVGADLRVRPRA